MKAEIRQIIGTAKDWIVGKKADADKGYAQEERDRVLRILSGNISDRDLVKYTDKILERAAYEESELVPNLVDEMERINQLTPDQLKKEVFQDAYKTAKEMGIVLFP